MALARSLPNDTLSILSQPGLPVAAHVAVKFAVLVTKWATLRRTRQSLAQLDDWQLRDVGLTPDEATFESRRVFWRF